jgi:glycosyltransferase involved in cell wall biosynthesis
MKVSGFTIVRDGVRFAYPFVESIQSILPLVDEFVVMAGDSQDETTRRLQSIGSDKLKVFDSVWDEKLRRGGRVMAQQTNLALEKCRGDWCFYLQADEVVHEQDHERLLRAMRNNLDKASVDGLSFRYHHFLADYKLKHPLFYRRQTRIIRNGRAIESVGDACGFGVPGRKLEAVASGAWIYHYGWVRPPAAMGAKTRQFREFYHGDEQLSPEADERYRNWLYDVAACVPFHDSHPRVMQQLIAAKDWESPPFEYRPWWRNRAWWDGFMKKNFRSLYGRRQKRAA